MSKDHQRYCDNCGKVNTADANFCNKCGTVLSDQNPIAHSKEQQKKQGMVTRSNSYIILGITFIFSVIVILLILKSNRDNLYKKLNLVKERQNSGSSDLLQTIQKLNLELLKDPDDYNLNVKIANTYFDTRNFSNAITHYRRALSIKNTDPNVLIDLGVSFFNLNQLDSALVYIKKALKIESQHLQGLYNAGIVHYNLGNYNEAVRYWNQLIEAHKDTEEALRASQFINQIEKQLNKS